VEAAIADWSEAIRIEPTAWACIRRGEARVGLAELSAALDDFTRAIELDPRLPDAYLARARLRPTVGDLERALAVAPRGWEGRSEAEAELRCLRRITA